MTKKRFVLSPFLAAFYLILFLAPVASADQVANDPNAASQVFSVNSQNPTFSADEFRAVWARAAKTDSDTSSKSSRSLSAATAYSNGSPRTTSAQYYSYYFPWYDSQYGRTWILTSVPKGQSDNVFDIYLHNGQTQQMQLVGGSVGVATDKTAPNYYANRIDGPVEVKTHNGPGLVSERSLFGPSFEEIWGPSYFELDSHYYWPVYDGIGAQGMKDWVLVANPPEGPDPVQIDVVLHVSAQDGGDKHYSTVLNPGQSVTPQFPGYRSGPLEVTAWKAGGSPSNQSDARDVIASQRVLYNGSFNEMPGIADYRLWSAWAWTWYDNKSAGAKAWISIGNPGFTDTYIIMVIGKNVYQLGPIHAQQAQSFASSTPTMSGPVLMMACSNPSSLPNCESTKTNVYASQRSLWGSSFSEISGVNGSSLTANWTWYDNQSAGSTNWVLITNLHSADIYAEISVAGTPCWSGWVPRLGNVTPSFPGIMGGAVQVKAWLDQTRNQQTDEFFASQRVLWNGYFNEIVGKGI